MNDRSPHADLPAQAGDWIEVHPIGGGPPRRGQILEVIGRPGHERYRVRWDEKHESIHFPGGATIIRHRPRVAARSARDRRRSAAAAR